MDAQINANQPQFILYKLGNVDIRLITIFSNIAIEI